MASGSVFHEIQPSKSNASPCPTTASRALDRGSSCFFPELLICLDESFGFEMEARILETALRITSMPNHYNSKNTWPQKSGCLEMISRKDVYTLAQGS